LETSIINGETVINLYQCSRKIPAAANKNFAGSNVKQARTARVAFKINPPRPRLPRGLKFVNEDDDEDEDDLPA